MFNKKDKEINKSELNEVISLSKRLLKILYIVFIVVIILFLLLIFQKIKVINFLVDLFQVISPFFIGFIVAWLLRPIVKKVNEYIKSYTVSSFIVFVSFILIVGTLLYIFIPTFYNEVNELVGVLPGFVEKIISSINDIFLRFSDAGFDLSEFKSELISNINTYSAEITKDLPNTIMSIIGTFISGLGSVGMGLVIGIYILIDYDNIAKHFKNMFPESIRDDVSLLATKMGVEARKCVNGTFLVALMVLVCDSVGFALIGLNAPLLFGFFCGVTDLIPFIGPYIGGAAAVIVGLTQSPIVGICALVICIIVQLIENYVLQPVVMSKASSLHPVIIIIALLVFGHFFGILGMILATPVLTIIRVLIEFTVMKVREHKEKSV